MLELLKNSISQELPISQRVTFPVYRADPQGSSAQPWIPPLCGMRCHSNTSSLVSSQNTCSPKSLWLYNLIVMIAITALLVAQISSNAIKWFFFPHGVPPLGCFTFKMHMVGAYVIPSFLDYGNVDLDIVLEDELRRVALNLGTQYTCVGRVLAVLVLSLRNKPQSIDDKEIIFNKPISSTTIYIALFVQFDSDMIWGCLFLAKASVTHNKYSDEGHGSKNCRHQKDEGEWQKKKLLDSKIASQWWARNSILGRDRRVRVLRYKTWQFPIDGLGGDISLNNHHLLFTCPRMCERGPCK